MFRDLPAQRTSVSAFSRGNLREPIPSFVCHCLESCSTTIHLGFCPGPPGLSLQETPWSPHHQDNLLWRHTPLWGCYGWCGAWVLLWIQGGNFSESWGQVIQNFLYQICSCWVVLYCLVPGCEAQYRKRHCAALWGWHEECPWNLGTRFSLRSQ